MPQLSDPLLRAYWGGTFAGRYELCVSPAGEVTSVTPLLPILGANRSIIATLKRWRYQPAPKGTCSAVVFKFSVMAGPGGWPSGQAPATPPDRENS